MLPPPFSMWCYHMKIYDRETTSPSKVLSEITSLSIEETGALFGLILGFTDGTKNQYGGYFHWRLNAARDINITRNTVYFDTLQSEQIKSISYKLARSTDHCPVSVRRDNIFIVETKGRVRTLRGDSAPSTPGERVSAINAATGVAGAPFETLALESFKCSPE
ncbi:uncharacterized protein BROUX77_005997 [Berkeleyomyces rouxiae]|uniref:uncharacterized protein n=1 Tax=Berkeleyomyces rouxiae TaxID=2035830 RepID=UPI003B7B8820